MNYPAENTHALIQALRDELQEDGALLQTLKDQQHSVLKQESDRVLELNASIETRLISVHRARQTRQRALRALAGKICDDASPVRIADILPYFPESVSPMICALVDEINRLLTQTTQYARQNQMLLVRAIDATQAALRTVDPFAIQKTYSPQGKLKLGFSSTKEGDGRCLA